MPSTDAVTPGPFDATEQALEEVFRHMPVGVMLTDLHGTIIDANHAFCTLLVRSREEIVGTLFTRFMHPDEHIHAEKSLGLLRDLQAPHAQSTRRYITSDGRTITARVTASIVHAKDGEAVCGIAFVEDIGERLEMERALGESEQRYRQVVEDQTELITRCRPDGTRIFVNQAYCRYNDATAEELLGTSFFSCIPEEERERIHQKFAALTPEQPVITESHRIIDPRGQVRWHEWTDRGYFDDHGVLVEVQAVGRDITEEREARAQLARSEESFRLLHESLPMAVWETDFSVVLAALHTRGLATPEALIDAVERDPSIFFEFAREARPVRANRAALTMTGASDPAGVFAWLLAHYTIDAAHAYIRGAARLLLGDTDVVDVELPFRAPDGRRIDMLQRLAKVPAWPGEPRLIAIALDVTKRKEVERALVHRTQVLEEAELLARVGSWDWDPATEELYGSAGFWRLLDGSTDAASRSLTEVIACFHEEDRDHIRARFESLRRTGNDLPDGDRDVRVVHPGGTVLICRGAGFSERNAAGAPVRVYGVIQDLTRKRQAEEAANLERAAMTRADKMISLGILVSGVAHEISNPNHAILLNTPLLREAWKSISPIVDRQADEDPDLRVSRLPWNEVKGEAAAMIDDIEHAAERVRAIVSELHGFARSHDSGEHRNVQVNDVVQSALRLLNKHIRKCTRSFSVALTHDLPPVCGNAQRLEQIVVNLLLNSCQALESDDAMLSVETGRTASHVFVRVTDGGKGIRKEDLLMIKDPFFTTKRAEGGSGLGLAVSERIVQEHRGELTFDSAPGRGTVATLLLPETAS